MKRFASETQSNFGPNAFTAHRHNSGIYSQLLFAPADAYTVTLGGRYENNEKFGNFFTYRAAGSVLGEPGWVLAPCWARPCPGPCAPQRSWPIPICRFKRRWRSTRCMGISRMRARGRKRLGRRVCGVFSVAFR